MIKSAKISGFRGLKEFDLNGLGRINLLVGKNNSGKSSVLEALYILATAGNPVSLWNTLTNRGEQFAVDNNVNRAVQPELDISHLFNGHELKIGSFFSVKTKNNVSDGVKCSIVPADIQQNPALFANLQSEGNTSLALEIEGDRVGLKSLIPLTMRGGYRQDTLQLVLRILGGQPGVEPLNTQYVSASSLSVAEVMSAWGEITLTLNEERVIDALKALDPKIERIAAVQGTLFQMPGRGGFFIKRQGEDKRIPIGSFGDGVWRLLAIATAVVRAKDGILLIDEIDAGLHHSVMANMWKIISKAATELNVQVFATTHSQDCVRSLASICTPEAIANNDVTIQRIEADKGKSVSYTSKQIQIAAEQDIEVR